MVSEEPTPTMGTIGALLGEIAPQQRPLKPVRVERKKVPLQEGQEVKILLSVVRAYDVPVRSEQDPVAQQLQQQQQQQQQHTPRMGSSDAMRDVLPSEALVRSYVEARFQSDSARTTSAPGPNPAWNQQLTLNFSSSEGVSAAGMTAEALAAVRDSLHIHLFDEVSVDLLEDPSERSTQVHRRLERKWLGSLSVPFSSLFRNTRVEGTFRLRSPPVLLGYERTGHHGGALGGGDDGGEAGPTSLTSVGGGGGRHHRDATYLNLYLTVEPPLAAPDPPRERLDCGEEGEDVVRQCERWRVQLANKFPDRRVNPMVADVNGRSVLLTRYLRRLRPPEQLLSGTSTGAGGGSANDDDEDENPSSGSDPASRVAWFVSLVPYASKQSMFPGLQEIWPSSADFLAAMCGSECEHAVLLANYLCGIGKTAYLVLGRGVPEGDTAYALTVEESGDQLLWNAVTGETFGVAATFCPLTSVYAVANESEEMMLLFLLSMLLSNILIVSFLFSQHVGQRAVDLLPVAHALGLFLLLRLAPALLLRVRRPQPAERAAGAAGGLHARQEGGQHSQGEAGEEPQVRAGVSVHHDEVVAVPKLDPPLSRETLMRLRRRQRTTINFNGTAVLRKLLSGLEQTRGGLDPAVEGGKKWSLAAEHLSQLARLNSAYKVSLYLTTVAIFLGLI